MERMDLMMKDTKVRLVKVDSKWFVVAGDIGGLLGYKRKNHCITHIKEKNQIRGKVKLDVIREVVLISQEGIIDILESCTLKNNEEERIEALKVKEFLEIMNGLQKTDFLRMLKKYEESIDIELENCYLKKNLEEAPRKEYIKDLEILLTEQDAFLDDLRGRADYYENKCKEYERLLDTKNYEGKALNRKLELENTILKENRCLICKLKDKFSRELI